MTALPTYLTGVVRDGPPPYHGPEPWDPPADTRGVPASWRLLDDVALLELPDPEYLVDGLIQRRSVGTVYGPPGAGKTTFDAALAVCIATGRPFFGHPINHPGAVLYVGAEDPAGFKVRLRAAKQAAGLDVTQRIGVYTFPEAIDLCDPVQVSRFEAFLSRHQADRPWEIIIGDTFAALTPGAAENSSEDVTTAMVHALRWRNTFGATVLFNHHTNAAGTRERGHSAMRGAADFMISLTPVDDVVHVESSKQRNGPPFPTIQLRLVPGVGGHGVVFRLAADVISDGSLTTAQAKALGVLRDTFGPEGASKSEWQRACPDIADRTFFRATKVLDEQGYVQQVGPRFRVTSKGHGA